MKLSGRTDIGAPIGFVFDFLTDFDGWERTAMRRGADVNRTDKLRVPGVGMTWQARFAWRGRERQVQVRLTQIAGPGHMALEFDGPSVEGTLHVELVELAAKRTRMLMQVEAKPRTLPARLLMQSMRLAKAKLQKRYDARLASIARDIEQRFAA